MGLNKCTDPRDGKTYILSFKRYEPTFGTPKVRMYITHIQLFDSKKKASQNELVDVDINKGELISRASCTRLADDPLGGRRGPYFNKEGRELKFVCDYHKKAFEGWVDEKDPNKKCSITINGLHCLESTQEKLLDLSGHKCVDPIDGKTYLLSFERMREFDKEKGMILGKKMKMSDVKLVPSGEKEYL